MRPSLRGLLLGILLSFLTGCGVVPRAGKRAPGIGSTAAWRQARADLQAWRTRLAPSSPYLMRMTMVIEQRQLGKRMRARGAVAVLPPHALRMVLLGPGGTTALDLWICNDRFRFAVPALQLERRGDRHTPREELVGLPVDFLRWWFLHPLQGKLLSYEPAPDEHFVLGGGDHVVHLRPSGDWLQIERASRYDVETMRVESSICGHVAYAQRSTGISLEVQCEDLDRDKPPPMRAFADPDDLAKTCLPAAFSLPSRGAS